MRPGCGRAFPGTDMKNPFERFLADALARQRENRSNGPHAAHRATVLGLANLRNRIAVLTEPHVQRFLHTAMTHMASSRAQIFQDAFVLHVLGTERPGFFVDFGATDGVSLSNSWLLETRFGWSGILAEPARNWEAALRVNRPGARIETRCVWTETGAELVFRETVEKELSTIDSFARGDTRAGKRQTSQTYTVASVSLNDMLAEQGAPAPFDYLSIDTEGSEFAILSRFDIARYRPRVITVEHNYTPRRRDIHALLSAAGYRRVLTEVSLFDDWYLSPGVELPEG